MSDPTTVDHERARAVFCPACRAGAMLVGQHPDDMGHPHVGGDALEACDANGRERDPAAQVIADQRERIAVEVEGAAFVDPGIAHAFAECIRRGSA